MTDGAGDPSRFNRPSRATPRKISSAYPKLRFITPAEMPIINRSVSRIHVRACPVRANTSARARARVCWGTLKKRDIVRPARAILAVSFPRYVSLTCNAPAVHFSLRTVRSNCCIPVACEAPFSLFLFLPLSLSHQSPSLSSVLARPFRSLIVSPFSHLLSLSSSG